MKFTKLFASGMVASVLMMSLNSMMVSAGDINQKAMDQTQSASDSVNYDEYFAFVESGNDRIDHAGNFTFDINNAVDSTKFYVTNSTIQILINATPYGEGDGDGAGLGVYIMNADTDKIAGVQIFPCDGENHTKSYSGLDTNQKYYLRLYNYSGSSSVEGYGRVGWSKKA